VDPSLYNSSNEYLDLLYKDVVDISELEVVSMSRYGHPMLFFRKLIGERSILHHHWFEIGSVKAIPFIAWKLLWLKLYRMSNGEIIWTIHNIYPHNEKYSLLNKISRVIFAHIASKLHVHCHKAISIMSKVLKVRKDKFFVIKHPDYPVDIYLKEKAIENFKLAYPDIKIDFDKKIFLVFGQMAKYKGIKELINVMSYIQDDCILLLAGEIKGGNDEYVQSIKKYVVNNNIVFLDHFIANKNIPILFNIADSVLFNYTRILTSGGVVLALNYNKLTIAPNKGCISEIDNNNLVRFDNSEQLKGEILKVLNE
jgi:glycosyltransferase involved in cell wall biosynthesis